jgi:hypothetical protein
MWQVVGKTGGSFELERLPDIAIPLSHAISLSPGIRSSETPPVVVTVTLSMILHNLAAAAGIRWRGNGEALPSDSA